jgi:tight adherence protein C
MTLALLLGSITGGGVWLLIRGLWPARPTLAASLSALLAPPVSEPPPPAVAAESGGGWAVRLGRPLLASAAGRAAAHLVPASLLRDLAAAQRSLERHLAEKLGLALAGLLLAPALLALAAVAGADVSVTLPLGAGLILAAAGFLLPDLSVTARAAERRREMRHALSAVVDLVVVGLAGGSGIEAALLKAASIGQGWATASIRHALEVARLTRESPWAALRRLGAELQVAELEELAASVGLAGTEGARVRQSLVAKAASLRMHAQAEAEARAHSATERLILPVALLCIGFLVFIGFPAVERVLSTG